MQSFNDYDYIYKCTIKSMTAIAYKNLNYDYDYECAITIIITHNPYIVAYKFIIIIQATVIDYNHLKVIVALESCYFLAILLTPFLYTWKSFAQARFFTLQLSLRFKTPAFNMFNNSLHFKISYQ